MSASSEWYAIAGVALDLDRRGALSEGGGRCTVWLMPFAPAVLTEGENVAVAAPGDGPGYELRYGRAPALLSESRFGDDPSANLDADVAAAAETIPRPALSEDDAAVRAEIVKSGDDPILTQAMDIEQHLDLIIQQTVATAKAQGDENTGSWTVEEDAAAAARLPSASVPISGRVPGLWEDAEAVARMIAARARRDDRSRQASQTPPARCPPCRRTPRRSRG